MTYYDRTRRGTTKRVNSKRRRQRQRHRTPRRHRRRPRRRRPTQLLPRLLLRMCNCFLSFTIHKLCGNSSNAAASGNANNNSKSIVVERIFELMSFNTIAVVTDTNRRDDSFDIRIEMPDHSALTERVTPNETGNQINNRSAASVSCVHVADTARQMRQWRRCDDDLVSALALDSVSALYVSLSLFSFLLLLLLPCNQQSCRLYYSQHTLNDTKTLRSSSID